MEDKNQTICNRLKEIIKTEFNEDIGFDEVANLLQQGLQRKKMKVATDFIVDQDEKDILAALKFADEENKKFQKARLTKNFEVTLVAQDWDHARGLFNGDLPKYCNDEELEALSKQFAEAVKAKSSRTFHTVRHIQNKRLLILSSKEHKTYQENVRNFLAQQNAKEAPPKAEVEN